MDNSTGQVFAYATSEYGGSEDATRRADDAELLRESFAGTLRRKRARQRANVPAVRWQARWAPAARLNGDPVLLGAAVEEIHLHTGPFPVSRGSTRRRRGSGASSPHTAEFELLEYVCREAARWDRPLRLMVSLAERSMPDEEFVVGLASVLENTSFPPSRLDLTLHEAALNEGNDPVTYSLAVLRDHGVGLWLTRFGHDVSSMTLLRDHAGSGLLSGVCLDAGLLTAGFVAPAPGEAAGAERVCLDPVACNFYANTISAVRALGLAVHLSEVGDEQIYAFVRETGCDEFSGTYCDFPEARNIIPPVAGSREVARRMGFARSGESSE
ncbi:EAL domain-containing protein [Brytella acorum]|uniref:EAL domain-containing protein n=1 Tax=Brytella acorum TaxID=2959299 RepID=A0AA35Y569_9PROT|nr:EAL domain-containing protein [Brytella acorum]MDF3624718.1 EAL domain-containing protein [Brytella acorum]CAI9121758.1 EAL domain-containing protein [Brytella acorum]